MRSTIITLASLTLRIGSGGRSSLLVRRELPFRPVRFADLFFSRRATTDLEWYDPDAVTTENGSLVITLSEEPSHGLNFRSGMLQSWNKFCFQGGYIEFGVSLPGKPTAQGFWPAVWTFGKLAFLLAFLRRLAELRPSPRQPRSCWIRRKCRWHVALHVMICLLHLPVSR